MKKLKLPKFHWAKLLSVFFFILLLGAYENIFAIGSKYAPGATLDPACPPGEVNCTVDLNTTETDPVFSTSTSYGITGTDVSNWNSKQAVLVSGTNIKTINSASLLGSGDIAIPASPITVVNSSNLFSTGLTGTGSGVTTTNSIFLGIDAGNGATDAFSSNFLGKNSGYGATDSMQSNFLGEESGYGASNAISSNFLGYDSGYEAINAGHSNFFGEYAGFQASSSYNSNFFGFGAGDSSTNANDSNFLGHAAGASATEANSSNFFGPSAGELAINASNSNFFGPSAGYGATNAANSIFIGSQSGYNDTVNNTLGGTSILIGDNTNTGGYSNSILLGSGMSGSPISNTKANQFMLAPSVTEMRLRGVDYSLPSSQGGAGTVLKNDGNGVLTWGTDNTGGGSNAWDAIGDPTGNGSIAMGSTVQTMDWATATTTNPLSITAAALTTGKLLSLTSNSLTSGTLLDITSSGAAGLTGQKGINVVLSGVNGAGAQTTYGGYFSNTHTSSAVNVGLYATTTGGASNYAAIFDQGNVGIGTNAPPSKLTVYDTDVVSGENQLLRMATPTGTAGVTIGYEADGINAISGIIRSVGNVPLHFSADSTAISKAMTILYSGKIGIGTTNPLYKLSVSGSTVSDVINSDMGFNVNQVLDPTAPSAIAQPGSGLEIGNYWYSVTYYTATGETHSTYIPSAVTTTSGNQQVQITLPISSDPRVIGRKIYRTKVGAFNYLDYYLATITNNTATTYIDNTADTSLVGSPNAAYFRTNTTSQNFTINGVKSLNIDDRMVSIGVGSGSAITTGGRNTLVGAHTGMNLTSGFDNTINGFGINDLTTGSNNTLVGSYAGGNNSTGHHNSAFGYSSLGNLNGAPGIGFNTAIGSFSGLSITGNANTNVFIGANSGNNVLQKVDAVNSIAIGYQTYTNANNQIVLGNTSITQTLLNGKVGIGLGMSTPATASLNLPAGTATAGTAPLKLTSGTLLGTAEVGAIEFLTDTYYGTITTGAARKQFAFTTDISTALNSYIPYTGGTTNVDLGVHNLTVDTNTISVDSATHRLGVGVTSPLYKLDISGDMQLQNGVVGIGIIPDTKYLINLNKYFDSTTNQAGIRNLIYFSPTSNNSNIGYGMISSARKSGNFDTGTVEGVYAMSSNHGNGTISLANAFSSHITLYGTTGSGSITDGNGLFVDSPVRDAGNTGTIGNLVGVRIKNQGSSYVSNAYGLYIENQTGAVTNNYSIYSTGGKSYFAGSLGLGSGATSPSSILEIGSSDLGNGVAGPIITLGRNTNGTATGAGSINFLSKAGTAGYVWQDAAGNMRINTSSPSSANDTAGTVVGAQTSTRETKTEIIPYTDYAGALMMITSSPLNTFRYIKEVEGYGFDSPLAKTRIGFIADEVDPAFMVGNVIDQVSVNGLLMASIKELDLRVKDLSSLDISSSTSLGSLIKQFIEDEANRFEKIFTKTVVTEGIEMKDMATGEDYCVVIINGDFDKIKGKCGEPEDLTSDTEEMTPAEDTTPIVELIHVTDSTKGEDTALTLPTENPDIMSVIPLAEDTNLDNNSGL